MPLTMTPQRFEQIRQLVRERQLAREAAEIVATTDWSNRPAFTSVDEFLSFLDRLAAAQNRPIRQRRKKV